MYLDTTNPEYQMLISSLKETCPDYKGLAFEFGTVLLVLGASKMEASEFQPGTRTRKILEQLETLACGHTTD